MKTFLRENWPWIVVPFLAVTALVVAVLATTASGAVSPFHYRFF